MAYKDEYEVARLHTDGSLQSMLEQQFTGDYKVKLHLAPPLLSRPDPVSGKATKKTFGPWIFSLLRPLAKMKVLRGTPFDIFGYTQERRLERRLIRDYEKLLDEHLDAGLASDTQFEALLELVSLPASIRGFGHVKQANVEKAEERKRVLLEKLYQPAGEPEQQQVA